MGVGVLMVEDEGMMYLVDIGTDTFRSIDDLNSKCRARRNDSLFYL